MENRSTKLDEDAIERIRTFVDEANTYLDDSSIERLQLSIVRQFPEVCFSGCVFRITQ